ncbi:MAG: tetratricopeptide repeat protein [Rhodospirillaceae bacterium]|nr:tetratricopeptide repeat protein [Rhodospirillaceae bacterium]
MTLQKILEAAVSQHQAGHLTEAKRLYRRALEQDPNQPDALNLLGVITAQKGDLDQALILFDKAITAAPTLAVIPFNKGNALREADRTVEAQIAYEAALNRDPKFQDALLNLSVLLQESDQPKQALQHLKTLVQYNPNHDKAHYNIGKCYQKLGHLDDAANAFQTALTLNTNDHDAHFAIASVHADRGQYDDAITHIKTAINIKPNWAQAFTNLGNYLTCTDCHDEALGFYGRALEIEADNINARVNRGLTLLTLGRLEEGWSDYNARAKSDAPFYGIFENNLPQWQGEDLATKDVLVLGEQALGEEVLFASFLPNLASTVKSCTLLCSSKLKTVFTRSFSNISNVHVTDQLDGDADLTDLDLQLSLVDLGLVFRPTISAFPESQPYLAWNPDLRAALRAHLEDQYGADQKFVGISWASSNPLIGDTKTVPLPEWAPLLSAPGVTFVNVQYGQSAQDIAALPDNFKEKIASIDMVDLNGDLDETLSLLAALDQVITCSNTTAHLAGAAGLSTQVLVPNGRARIWYWFKEGASSPWYKNTRLARKSASDGWDKVMGQIASRDF